MNFIGLGIPEVTKPLRTVPPGTTSCKIHFAFLQENTTKSRSHKHAYFISITKHSSSWLASADVLGGGVYEEINAGFWAFHSTIYLWTVDKQVTFDYHHLEFWEEIPKKFSKRKLVWCSVLYLYFVVAVNGRIVVGLCFFFQRFIDYNINPTTDIFFHK